ncbi:MAG TPA: redoxin family protein [Thermoanaerobaculia bacterium]|jgi:thioredoxin-like negative regulator of GroEL
MPYSGRLVPLFAGAALVFGLCIAVAGDESGGRLAEAGRLAKEGKHREAAAAYRKANKEAAGKCAECLIGLSRSLLSTGDMGESAKAAREAIALTEVPSLLASAYHNLGTALYVQAMRRGGAAGQIAEAEEALRSAIAADKENRVPGARLMLAQLLVENRRDQEAVPLLEDLLADTPTGTVADNAKTLLARAKLYRDAIVPELALITLNGDTIHLRELTGKVVLLDFWATWCGPCRKSLPGLKTLQGILRNEPFQLISVSIDQDRRDLEKFVQRNRMDWAQIWDQKAAVMRAFGVRAVPTYFLIDHQGRIVLQASGWSQDLEARVRAEVGKAVKSAR